MAHFAKVIDGLVTEVLVIDAGLVASGEVGDPTQWVQTSYNTRGGIHFGEDGQPDGGVALRKNYAGIGYTYDQARDAFIPPKPFASWTLNEEKCQWDAPVPYPSDDQLYEWDEDQQVWVLFVEPQ